MQNLHFENNKDSTGAAQMMVAVQIINHKLDSNSSSTLVVSNLTIVNSDQKAIQLSSVRATETLTVLKNIVLSGITVKDHLYSQSVNLIQTEGFSTPFNMQLIISGTTIQGVTFNSGGAVFMFKHTSTIPTVVDSFSLLNNTDATIILDNSIKSDQSKAQVIMFT